MDPRNEWLDELQQLLARIRAGAEPWDPTIVAPFSRQEEARRSLLDLVEIFDLTLHALTDPLDELDELDDDCLDLTLDPPTYRQVLLERPIHVPAGGLSRLIQRPPR